MKAAAKAATAAISMILVATMATPASAHWVYRFEERLWSDGDRCLGGKSGVTGYLETQAIAYAYQDYPAPEGQPSDCYGAWSVPEGNLGVKTVLQKLTRKGWTKCVAKPWKFNEDETYVVIQKGDYPIAHCGNGRYRVKAKVKVKYAGAWHKRTLGSGGHRSSHKN